MGAILNVLGWIVTFFTRLFGPIINVIYGFFSYLHRFLTFRILDKIADFSLWSTLYTSGKFATAISFLIMSVILVFISILGLLIRIFFSISDHVKSLTSGAGSDVSISLFSEILKSIGLMNVLADTWALWAVGFLIPFLTLMGSILYFKSVMKAYGALDRFFSSAPKGYSKGRK